MNVKLQSKKYEITKLNRKTKAKGFCNLKVGDIIYFETEIKPADDITTNYMLVDLIV